jgi:hypothetical protein
VLLVEFFLALTETVERPAATSGEYKRIPGNARLLGDDLKRECPGAEAEARRLADEARERQKLLRGPVWWEGEKR